MNQYVKLLQYIYLFINLFIWISIETAFILLVESRFHFLRYFMSLDEDTWSCLLWMTFPCIVAYVEAALSLRPKFCKSGKLLIFLQNRETSIKVRKCIYSVRQSTKRTHCIAKFLIKWTQRKISPWYVLSIDSVF